MTDHDLADLGDLEREVLLLVWRQGAATADSVRSSLSRPLKESTVRTGALSSHVVQLCCMTWLTMSDSGGRTASVTGGG